MVSEHILGAHLEFAAFFFGMWQDPIGNKGQEDCSIYEWQSNGPVLVIPLLSVAGFGGRPPSSSLAEARHEVLDMRSLRTWEVSSCFPHW